MRYLRINRYLLLALALVGLSTYLNPAPQIGAQGDLPTVVYKRFDPGVIPADRFEPVRFEAKVLGEPTRVVLLLDLGSRGQELAMNDGGSNGDLVAGDGVYSVLLAAEQLIFRLQPKDVFRPLVGYLQLFQGNDLVFEGNIDAQILTDEIPRLPVVVLSEDVQYTDYIVNIVDPMFPIDSIFGFDDPRINYERVVRKFYEFFPDGYDFLNIVSEIGSFDSAHYEPIKNEVLGIGLGLFDGSDFYRGDVPGPQYLLGLNVFPQPNIFDGADSLFQHELAHYSIMFVNAPPFAQSIPHWPVSSMASGTMGYSNELSGFGGIPFPCLLIPGADGVRLVRRNSAEVYTDMDLYLMGLLPADQVGQHYVFEDQDARNILDQCDGSVYSGTLIPVSVDDIIRALGPRVPDVTVARKEFKIGTIVVSRDGLLDEEAMAFYNFFAQRAEAKEDVLTSESSFFEGLSKPFFVSTQGLGTIDARIDTETTRPPLPSALPDLTADIVATLTAPECVQLGEALRNSSTLAVTNSGTADAGEFSIDVTLSKEFPLREGYVLLFESLDGLAAGETREVSAFEPIPTDIVPGDYYLIVTLDGFEVVIESDEENNLFAVMIKVVADKGDC